MSSQAASATRELVKDKGLDEGVARLTQEKIAKVVGAVLEAEGGARLKAYVDTCAHCGLCSEACHFFLSHDRDPRYSPVGKVKQTMWEIVEKNGNVSPEFIASASRVAYTECNMCKRCAMYCPFGIDIAYVISIMRRICHKLGVTPQYLQDTAHSHSATLNQMWVKDDEWIDALIWQEAEAREEVPGLRIPLEKEGADILYSVIGPEPKFRTQLIYQAAVIMHAAGVDWTMPATPGWDNSDMAMYSGDYEMMGRLKRAHFECAQRLGVKRIVMGECGHAFRSVHDMGNRWLGWKGEPVPVIHSVQFFHELLTSGKIKIKQKYGEAVTFHDPCNIVRGMGLHEMGREVTRALVPELVEMTPNREHNYCCSAGGGVINCGPPFRNTRVHGNKIKAEQLAATGVKTVIAPCHNCHGGLEDIIHHYKLDMKIKFLGDVIYECMEKPWAEE